MGRIRTIKPEFWADEELSSLPESTHMLAAALLNYADDFGYFNANPGLVRAACCPLREPSVSIPESFRSLQTIGYLSIGTAPDGKRYGRIIGFDRHQRVSHPTPSKIQSISIAWDDVQNPPEILRSPPDTFVPEQGTGNREQGTGNREVGTGKSTVVLPAAPAEPDQVAVVFDHWRVAMGHPQAKLDDKRRKVIRSAFRSGYDTEALCRAIDGCKLSPFHMGKNDRAMVYDDVGLILRSADHIDKFIRLADQPNLTSLSPAGRQTVVAAQSWLNNQADETETEDEIQ